MDTGRQDRAASASALIIAIENYEHHQKLDNLSAVTRELTEVLKRGGFVDALPSGRNGGRAQELTNQVKAWFAKASSDEYLILFWAGHGERESSRLYLMTQDSPAFDFDSTNAVEPSFIAKRAARSNAKRILLIFDACHSGGAIGNVIAEIGNAIDEEAPDGIDGRGIAVIASAHAIQQAQSGVLCGLLKDALTDASLPRRWSDSDRYIDNDRLTATLNDELRRRSIEQKLIPATYGETIELIPNPRYRAGLPPENVEERLWRLPRSEAADHFELAARGIEVGEQGWFFSGRKRLLRELVDWLETAEHGVRIVTGPPGAGKSAVMGRLATLSDEEFRREAIAVGAVMKDGDALPPLGAIDVAVHVKGKTLDDCARSLARSLDISVGQEVSVDIDRLVTEIGKLDRKITLMIDALDEATGGQGAAIASRLLAPLGRLPDVRVLVGSRRSLDGAVVPEGEDRHRRLRAAFGTDATIDDLADEKDTREDIAEYVRKRLANTEKHRDDDYRIIAATADRVAAQADGVFLYARIVSRTLQEQDALDEALPATAQTAFEQDIETRFKGDEVRVRDLLCALAWGEGKGLTRRVWPLVANAIAKRERSYDDDDIAWVLGHAGWHIIEAGEDGQALYRLAHQTLADLFHEEIDVGLGPTTEKQTQSRIVDALKQGIQGAAWLNCDRYLWRHLADHAAKAIDLDELIHDPGYLAVADPTRLGMALSSVASEVGCRLGWIYDRVVDRLIGQDPVERMSLIHMMAQMEDAGLAPLLEPPVRTRWRCRWARVRPSTPYRVIGKHDGFVTSIALGAIAGSPVIVSGSDDQTIRRWDARTGEAIGRPIEAHTDPADPIASISFGVLVAWSEIDGAPVIVSGSWDNTIRRWNARTGASIDKPLKGHTDTVSAIAFGVTGDGPVIISGSSDKTIRRWNARTGAPIGKPLKGHTDRVSAIAFGITADGPVIVSGSDDGTIRRWNARTGAPIGKPLEGHAGAVCAVALSAIDGMPVIISGNDDGTICRWNGSTGAPIGKPLQGHTDPVYAIAIGIAADGPVIVSGSHDGTIRRWNAQTGEAIGEPFIGHTGQVFAVALGAINDVPVVFSGGLDRTIRRWDANARQPIGRPLKGRQDSVTSVAWGAIDGAPVIVSGSSDKTIRRWNARTGALIGKPLEGHTDTVSAIAFGVTADGPVIVSGSYDKTIRLWNARTGEPIGKPLKGHRDLVTSVTCGLIDGAPWIVSGSYDETIRLWNARTGAPIGKPLKGLADSADPVPSVSFGMSVAWGEINGEPVVVSGILGTTIHCWNARTGEPIGRQLKGHQDSVTSVALGTIDGASVIVSGSYDKTIRLWNARTGEPLGEPLEGHTDSVCAVALGVIDDKPVVVSASEDGTVRCWDARKDESRLCMVMRIGDPVVTIDMDDSAGLAVGLERGIVLIEFLTMQQK